MATDTTKTPKSPKKKPLPKPGRKLPLEEAMEVSHKQFSKTFEKLAK